MSRRYNDESSLKSAAIVAKRERDRQRNKTRGANDVLLNNHRHSPLSFTTPNGIRLLAFKVGMRHIDLFMVDNGELLGRIASGLDPITLILPNGKKEVFPNPYNGKRRVGPVRNPLSPRGRYANHDVPRSNDPHPVLGTIVRVGNPYATPPIVSEGTQVFHSDPKIVTVKLKDGVDIKTTELPKRGDTVFR